MNHRITPRYTSLRGRQITRITSNRAQINNPFNPTNPRTKKPFERSEKNYPLITRIVVSRVQINNPLNPINPRTKKLFERSEKQTSPCMKNELSINANSPLTIHH